MGKIGLDHRGVDGMVRLDGGQFQMGSDDHYPEEGPARQVRIDPFWIDATPVTNGEFAKFVTATNHVTVAEQPPDPSDYPGILPDMMRAGSLVFVPPDEPVSLNDPGQWWQYVFGADWRHPAGAGSSLRGLDRHPVVHIAVVDAEAYAVWAGKALPTEAEWEFAARAGLEGAAYAWGDDLEPDGQMFANYWAGTFPHGGKKPMHGVRTTPVGRYPPNSYGLRDMIGNVWEWTADWFAKPQAATNSCCIPHNPRGGARTSSVDELNPEIPIARRVMKGGSHLCAPNYCQRYRPAARYPQPIDTSTSHVGFRCVKRAAELS